VAAQPLPSLREDDPLFLKPYRPCGFADPRPRRCTVTGSGDASAVCIAAGPNPPEVHVPRDGEHNFLFRIDPQPGGTVVIVVLSALEPDWNYAFGLKPGMVDPLGRPVGNAGYLLAALPEPPREMRLDLRKGTPLRFRLVANPTTKKGTMPKKKRTDPNQPGRHGRRVPVPTDDAALRGWLDRRAEDGGFRLMGPLSIQPGYVAVNKTSAPGQGLRVRTVRYDGVLEVTDGDSFRQTLVRGIGPAKAFGCGLLSVGSLPS
jgi:CRISPR system Cascade subunit CasE